MMEIVSWQLVVTNHIKKVGNMGYCMRQHRSDFFISVNKQSTALAAMIKLAKEKRNFYWVESSDFIDSTTLSEVLDAWRWEPKLDKNGNIISVSFVGEKIGDEDILWNTLAPYVRKDSYIEMAGEDGACWRWVFDGQVVAIQESGRRIALEIEARLDPMFRSSVEDMFFIHQ